MTKERLDQFKEMNCLRAQNRRMREALGSISNLISNSAGVYGLHLNGDTSPWEELLEGGRFEDWLISLSTAIKEVEDE